MATINLIPNDMLAKPIIQGVHEIVLSECSGSWTFYGPAQSSDDLVAPVAEQEALLVLGRLALAIMRASGPEPLMVDKAGAARLYDMSPATYDKYAKRGLLPRLTMSAGSALKPCGGHV